MAGKVFISCGQASDDERKVASDLNSWFSDEGYNPYLAIETQSILDLNAGIIDQLKTSDFYLFINFKREKLSDDNGGLYRGSLFTNQELAISYALRFEKMLMLNQKGVKHEGMHKFMVSNIPEFADPEEVVDEVKKAVQKANWSPTYSRLLVFHNSGWGPSVNYSDHTGQRQIRVFHGHIKNSRMDCGAIDTVARLAFITYPNGNREQSPDRSHLKVSGQPGYAQTIWPESTGTYDLLSLDMNNQSQIFLNSSHDVNPRHPLISQNGEFFLEYEIFSQGFPPLRFSLRLNVTGGHSTTQVEVVL